MYCASHGADPLAQKRQSPLKAHTVRSKHNAAGVNHQTKLNGAQLRDENVLALDVAVDNVVVMKIPDSLGRFP